MPSLSQLLSNLIRYTFYLALAGGLTDAVVSMRRNAAEATKKGLVSLKALNGALVSPTRNR